MDWLKQLRVQHWDSLSKLQRRLFSGLVGLAAIALILLATQSGQSPQVSSSSWLAGTTSQGSWTTSAGAGKAGTGSAPSEGGNASSGPQANVMVQVVGEVARPGVFSLKVGSRVLDAVFAAGGFTKGADQASVNLARLLNDGEQILVLPTNGASIGRQTSAGGPQGTINLNLADSATLDSLPGIGPTLAQRIIDYRQANGGFRSLSDLGKVAGIGQALLSKLRPLVSL